MAVLGDSSGELDWTERKNSSGSHERDKALKYPFFLTLNDNVLLQFTDVCAELTLVIHLTFIIIICLYSKSSKFEKCFNNNSVSEFTWRDVLFLCCLEKLWILR